MPNRLIQRIPLIAALALAAGVNAAEPVISSQLELREDSTAYSVKVSTPEPAALKARLEGNRLHLASEAPPGAPRLLNTLVLPAATGEPVVEPGDGIVTIRVAKGASNTADPFSGFFDNNTFPGSSEDVVDAVRNSMLSRFTDLWNQMDQMMEPGQRDLLDQIINRSMPGLTPPAGTSATDFQLADQPGEYVLTAKMPEAQAKNVRVNVDNGRFVSISSAGGVDDEGAFQYSSFTRAMTLPGAVRAEAMRVDYQDGILTITLPKDS